MSVDTAIIVEHNCIPFEEICLINKSTPLIRYVRYQRIDPWFRYSPSSSGWTLDQTMNEATTDGQMIFPFSLRNSYGTQHPDQSPVPLHEAALGKTMILENKQVIDSTIWMLKQLEDLGRSRDRLSGLVSFSIRKFSESEPSHYEGIAVGRWV